VAKGIVWCRSTSDERRLCAAVSRARGSNLENSPKAMHFWKSGFKFASGRNKIGKVFRILSHFKKPSQSNDVHA